MEKEIDIEVIKATQSVLSKYVKRPPLSEKLLKKPPFRFLHDIFMAVLKTTGFFEGLFDEQELISENVKDRESKILFLNKVISVVGLTLGKTLNVKPSKIVSGQEPEKTNELLQCIAQALDKNLSSLEAVKKIKKSGLNNVQKEKKPLDADKKKLTSKSSEKLNAPKKDNLEKSKTKPNIKRENSVLKKESPPKNSKQKPLTKKNSQDQLPINKQDAKSLKSTQKVKDIQNKHEDSEEIPKEPDNNIQRANDDKNIIQTNVVDIEKPTSNNSQTLIENDLNLSLSFQNVIDVENDVVESLAKAVENSDKDTDIENEKTINSDAFQNKLSESQNKESFNEDLVIPSAEINTVKEVKSSIKGLKQDDNNDVHNEKETKIIRPTSVRPSSSRPGAPRPKEKTNNTTDSENLLVGKVNIIIENSPAEEDEDSILVIDQHTTSNKEQIQSESTFSKEHGVLVHQILESQKEILHQSGKTEIEWELGAQKAREVVNKDIENLRFNIQAVSRVANPLGKLLDHVQEDVEVMRQELQQWKHTNNESAKELHKQKMANEDYISPLQTKLKQLNIEINNKHDKINDLRIVIHKNSVRIEKLLAMGTVQ